MCSIYPTDACCSQRAQPVCFAQFIDLRWLLHRTTPPTMEEATAICLEGGMCTQARLKNITKQTLHSDTNAYCMLSIHECIYIHCIMGNALVLKREDMTFYQPPLGCSWFPLARILHIPEWGHKVLWFYNFICALQNDLTLHLGREAKMSGNDLKNNDYEINIYSQKRVIYSFLVSSNCRKSLYVNQLSSTVGRPGCVVRVKFMKTCSGQA